MRTRAAYALMGLALTCGGGTAQADLVSPDSSYCIVSFTNPARDRITISPNGNGDTFASTGITLQVYLKNSSGAPLVGVPAPEVIVYNAALCICPGGNLADGATDANGRTTFSGTIRGGGCASSLTVFADGIAICTVPVKTNSFDILPSSPCFVDAGDLASLATRLGNPAAYTICVDWNEDGFIDAGDVAGFAQPIGATCQ